MPYNLIETILNGIPRTREDREIVHKEWFYYLMEKKKLSILKNNKLNDEQWIRFYQWKPVDLNLISSFLVECFNIVIY